MTSSGLLPLVCLPVMYTIIGIFCFIIALFFICEICTLVVTGRVLETLFARTPSRPPSLILLAR